MMRAIEKAALQSGARIIAPDELEGTKECVLGTGKTYPIFIWPSNSKLPRENGS